MKVRPVLASATDCGVDRDPPLQLPLVIGADQEGVDHLTPDPVLGPGAMPLPHRLPGPEPLGKIPPSHPAPIAENDPLDDLPVSLPQTP